jgi:hypothetical protein
MGLLFTVAFKINAAILSAVVLERRVPKITDI